MEDDGRRNHPRCVSLYPDEVQRIADQNRSRFALRIYRMRIAGVALGAIGIGAVLTEQASPAWLWWLLAANVLVWPHVAYRRARRNVDQVAAEHGNLLFDAAMGGVWIAVMQFNVLPSVLLLTLVMLDKVIVGGLRFMGLALLVMAAACLVVSALMGFPVSPVTSQKVLLASLPFLVIYPLLLGYATRSLAQKALKQKQLLVKMARFDGATGLMNRQQWLHAVTVALRNNRRTRRPAVLALIDIDHFKEINDTHGHLVGDSVIEEFAHLLKACFRDMDTVGRYGGDEFGVVMPDIGWEDAILAAERLRRQVAARAFAGMELRCTVSIGLCEPDAGVHDAASWVKAADVRLYEAKRRGRDCIVVVASESLASA